MGIETAAAVGAGGNLLGGAMGGKGAKGAAKAQASAARHAADLQGMGFLHTAQQLAPFTELGKSFIPQYQGMGNALWDTSSQALTPLTQSLYGIGFPTGATTTAATTPQINKTIGVGTGPYSQPITTAQSVANWGLGADQQAALEATPGYQFALDQGLKGVQNSAAASGRGVSGNALAGAGQFTTGIADQTFGNQYARMLAGEQQAYGQSLQSGNQYLNQLQQAFAQNLGVGQFELGAQQQEFAQQLAHAQALQALQGQIYGQTHGQIYDPMNALYQGISLGQNSAAMQGNQGITSANNIGNSLMAAGNAEAAGIAGASSAMQGGLGGASNALTNYLLMNSLGIGGTNSMFGPSTYGTSGTGGLY